MNFMYALLLSYMRYCMYILHTTFKSDNRTKKDVIIKGLVIYIGYILYTFQLMWYTMYKLFIFNLLYYHLNTYTIHICYLSIAYK